MIGSKLRAALGIARRQLIHGRGGTALAVLGVTVAVLLLTLLTGLGYGMTQAGTDAITWLEPDLWVTAGGANLTAGSVAGTRDAMVGAHAKADELEGREGVRRAKAMHFRTVYVSANRSEFTTVVGAGITGEGSDSEDFAGPDRHYAGGTYEGPRTDAVVLSRGTAEILNVSTGDTVYLGGTEHGARSRPLTVAGLSGRFSTFLGAPTATMYLSEFQEVTGETGSDRALLLGLVLEEGADRTAVRRDLAAEYPGLEFRSSQEQLRVVFENQGAVIASTVTLVVVAVATGTALVANAQALMVARQRRQLAALKAVGLRARTLVTVVGAQGLCIGALGGALGLLATPVAADELNGLVERLVGFPELIEMPWWVAAAGGGVALVMGLGGAAVAGWRVVRVSPLEHLSE